ncbi:hypothetical protein OG520_42620 (plasmid) [Streptomyces sp. NBC_00984]|uniref:hypothetical protein n=1 Tax=Streptomyces sp. NBC_00984 TaxID=2903700 RepID=UPI002F91774A|nr:hypothetical protein OG520_42620 [Streptomyces sp. NBC_00984]
MEQLRRGVAVPELHLVPPRPDAEKATALMNRPETAGRRLAALPDARATATTGRTARDKARHVLREAWRTGIEHQTQLDAGVEDHRNENRRQVLVMLRAPGAGPGRLSLTPAAK